MRTKLRLLALFAALCVLLAGCSQRDNSAQESAEASLPSPPLALEKQILGDTSALVSQEVTLYLPSAETMELTTVNRTIQAGADGSLPRAALQELLDAMPTGGSLLMSGARAALEDVEFGSGVATVRLSVDACVNRDDSNYLLLCASVANTLLGMDGVEAVNVLTGERCNPVCALPTGVFTSQSHNIPALYAQLLSERDRFPTAPLTRAACLYFPARGGLYLLPEVRRLSFADEDYAAELIRALCEGPEERDCCHSAVPANLELLNGEPEMSVTPDGERVLDLLLSPVIANYLALTGVESWQLYGSLVLTLTSFIPELDAVRIRLGSTPVTECDLGTRPASFPDGRMRRSDFAPFIGGSAWLYFANGAQGLTRQECAVSQAGALSARSVLGAMITLRDAPRSGVRPVLPEGIGPEDLLGVSVDGHIASVNLSANFYCLCQSLTDVQERQLIYAMVNALTELSPIGAVRFLVEGRQVDSLVGNVYLRSPLLPDPGLVVDATGVPSPEAEGSQA